jgi:hypothetical protein
LKIPAMLAARNWFALCAGLATRSLVSRAATYASPPNTRAHSTGTSAAQSWHACGNPRRRSFLSRPDARTTDTATLRLASPLAPIFSLIAETQHQLNVTMTLVAGYSFICRSWGGCCRLGVHWRAERAPMPGQCRIFSYERPVPEGLAQRCGHRLRRLLGRGR